MLNLELNAGDAIEVANGRQRSKGIGATVIRRSGVIRVGCE